jgi:membrane protein implicated in regulation of membrane protease activity
MQELPTPIPLYQILGSIGLALALLELVIPGFFILPIGVAFLLTAFFSFWITQWFILLPLLLFSSVISFWLLRSWFKKTRSSTPTNVEAMIGQECEVIEPIKPHSIGYVKLYGDRWAARSEHPQEIAPGTRVIIYKTDGNKVWVKTTSE